MRLYFSPPPRAQAIAQGDTHHIQEVGLPVMKTVRNRSVSGIVTWVISYSENKKNKIVKNENGMSIEQCRIVSVNEKE